MEIVLGIDVGGARMWEYEDSKSDFKQTKNFIS